MRRVRALTGSPSPSSRTKLLRAALCTLLALGLPALAPAPFAAAEPLTSAEPVERLAERLDEHVRASEGTDSPDATALAEAEPLAAEALPEGTTRTVEVAADGTVSLDLTVDADDLVAIRAGASGDTSDPDAIVGSYDLLRDGTRLDTVTLLKGETEESWFPLTEGTYTIEFRCIGASSARTLSLFWSRQGLDLEGGLLTLPANRSFDTALPIPVNRLVHGVFYWGYNAANPDSKLDGHYYEFELDAREAVTLILANPGTAQIAIMDGEGEVIEGADGTPMAASGTGSVSVDCGILDPGTYRILVVSTDEASWRRHYTAEVFAYPVDSQPTVGRSVYRLYNEWSGEHLFTASTDECDANVRAGWKNEGVAWIAPTSGTAVWRLSNPYSGEHLYTQSEAERTDLIESGWSDEGVAWHSDGPMGLPVYRLYNPYREGSVAAHHYTTDANEYRTLGDSGWRQEGVCWYGIR